MRGSFRRLGMSVVTLAERLGLSLVFVLVLLLVGNIVVREVFGMPLVWANEVSLILFAWTVFLGTAVAFSRNARIRFEFLKDKLPRKLRSGLDMMTYVLGLGGLLALLVIGAKLVFLNWGHRLTSLDASAAWQWACLPVGAAVAIIGWLSSRTDGDMPEQKG